MIARLAEKLFGHRFQHQATLPPRGRMPGLVVLVCGRCGAVAKIPATLDA